MQAGLPRLTIARTGRARYDRHTSARELAQNLKALRDPGPHNIDGAIVDGGGSVLVFFLTGLIVGKLAP